MVKAYFKQIVGTLAILSLLLSSTSCSIVDSNEEFFGKTTPPDQKVLHYITGDEPESLDPHKSTGQPEARIFMALYEGLVEYDPKDMQPRPAIAERWDENNDSSEFVFHLRKNARWSNGDPINAYDVLYSFRRALAPETRARAASFGYYIKYSQAYNSGAVFVLDPQTGEFVLESDLAPVETPPPLSVQPVTWEKEYKPAEAGKTPHADTPFHQFMHSPARLTLPGDEKTRNKLVANNAKLQALVANKEFVKVQGKDIGVEAVDDYTLRISLHQSAPFFKDLLAHQLFRLAPKKAIEQFGENWTQPANIITCGAFKLKLWKPYDVLAVERDPMYWDAAAVQLDEIDFYPMADLPTAMNLYKVGDVDAVYNHSVLSAWVDTVRPKKDYMAAPEAASVYININTTKPPTNDLRVRRAFDLAINKETWVKWKKIIRPLHGITPKGIFPDYKLPPASKFDPEKARQLLGEAGFPVTRKSDGSYECAKFPVDQIEYLFPTATSNKIMAEFMQAQWKQNLGITVPLRAMEFRTFVDARSKLDYKGFSFGAWGADYMDPFTFLGLYYVAEGDNCTGWWDQNYVDLLDKANRTPDRLKRYEILSQAENYMIEAQPIIPIETAAVNWVKKPYVKGMYPNAGSLYPWKFVYIERDPSKWDYGTPAMDH
jgi:oligopeptide transport system substrate-binding protein